MVKRANISRIEKVEKKSPAVDFVYQLNVTVILDDETTDDEIKVMQDKYPAHRHIRLSDFADECT